VSRDERVDRALEVFVYGPLGLGLWIRDLAPSVIDTIVARGRAEVDRRQEQAQQHVTTARSMGQVAIAFGVPKLRARAERQVGAVREQADRIVGNLTGARTNGAGATASTMTPPPRHAPTADAPPVAPSPVENAASAAPSEGYDALSASQVVERLAGLGGEELTAVREYEVGHRNRRTILGKIDQLTAK
jgi:hypothetical protein